MKSLIILAQFTGLFAGEPTCEYNKELVDAVKAQTKDTVVYDGSYYVLKYPGGDVPKGIGVCTDVVIRAYRKIGFDLQQLIHEDMKKAFAEYNRRRKSNRIDASIDHRRTPNMQTFFSRQGAKLPVTEKEEDYLPGDIVFWDVAQGHVGMVVDEKIPGTNRYYIVHNICCGNNMEDFLFGARIVDHYRWSPKKK
ncbi:MAG TPA: DUF1287 domain-containing protein [Flavobacteriales bacterium]|nr:DUF1287 domain-containing protein [Flavobacteriales bacterium]